MAQDNSYTMFSYLISDKVRDEIKKGAYYIIDKEQPDYENVKQYGNKVVNFMSIRHLIYLQAAKLFVSIDSKRHAYIWRSRNSMISDSLKEKPFLFLQHGVIGFKRVDYIYKKGGINSANHIVVASEKEKGIAMKWFGYGEDEVILAGMARWDRMEDCSQQARDILFMPTWRNWLQEKTEDEFIASDYYKHYSGLLRSKELEEFLEQNDLRLIFCMHPKFREFMDKYQVETERIQLFAYDTKPIIELIMECRLLITDYSSVSWDVYYLKKPIIFYQFDYNKYMECQGSYYDMEKELFGPRVLCEEDLLSELKKYCANGFKEEEQFADMREVCLPSEPKGICKPIYDEIELVYFGEGERNLYR
jgi:CDP-glycerol glycerophosphotransferase (TagB/SpsB family)